MKPPKGTFPHVVTTPREVSGSYHHQCAEQRPRTLWSTCGPLRTQADPGGPSRFHRSLERVLFRGLKSPRFLESDFKKRGGFMPDDDRLNAAVSRAGFGPAVSVGCTSAAQSGRSLGYARQLSADGIEKVIFWPRTIFRAADVSQKAKSLRTKTTTGLRAGGRTKSRRSAMFDRQLFVRE